MTARSAKRPSCQAKLHLSKVQSAEREGTSKVNGTRAARRVKVTGDGKGVAGHAGALLLAELADRVGLTDEDECAPKPRTC